MKINHENARNPRRFLFAGALVVMFSVVLLSLATAQDADTKSESEKPAVEQKAKNIVADDNVTQDESTEATESAAPCPQLAALDG